LLERLGYRVDVVANGLEAIEALSRINYDLVLMDCQMPEMDGISATTRIRTSEGSSRRIPIIAMTADAFPGDRDRCLAAGMNDFLSKPVELDRLEAVIERWIRNPDATGSTIGDASVCQAEARSPS
jgi:CheY-like chemotaxis protein